MLTRFSSKSAIDCEYRYPRDGRSISNLVLVNQGLPSVPTFAIPASSKALATATFRTAIRTFPVTFIS